MALNDHGKAAGEGPERGVWKSGSGNGHHHTKGRQLFDFALAEVRDLLAGAQVVEVASEDGPNPDQVSVLRAPCMGAVKRRPN